jgi:hypothetical protein
MKGLSDNFEESHSKNIRNLDRTGAIHNKLMPNSRVLQKSRAKALSIAKKNRTFRLSELDFTNFRHLQGSDFTIFVQGGVYRGQSHVLYRPLKVGNRIIILNDGHYNFIHIVIGM